MSDSTANRTMPQPGTITWTEIPAQDLDRVQNFYKEVFGWEFTPMPPPVSPETGEKMTEPTYVLFQKSGCHGGFMKVEPLNHLSPAMHTDNADKKKMCVTVTLSVDSIDESLKAIEKAGGKTYRSKQQIPGENMGHHASFLDSENNVMGLWSMH